MSVHADPADPAVNGSTSPDAHTHEGKFHIFVQLAMALSIITGGELLIIYLPMPDWIIITGLMLMSVVKFVAVIFIFMHLKWDKPFNTILFFMGLIVAGGTMWALLALHGAEAAIPVGPAYEQF
jgi:cytochrome c oxidase subunit IV